MKKFTLTLFGLFLVAATFASVKPIKGTNLKTQNIAKSTLMVNKTLVNQINKVVAITSKAALGGPKVVVRTCATRCEDEL